MPDPHQVVANAAARYARNAPRASVISESSRCRSNPTPYTLALAPTLTPALALTPTLTLFTRSSRSRTLSISEAISESARDGVRVRMESARDGFGGALDFLQPYPYPCPCPYPYPCPCP